MAPMNSDKDRGLDGIKKYNVGENGQLSWRGEVEEDKYAFKMVVQ